MAEAYAVYSSYNTDYIAIKANKWNFFFREPFPTKQLSSSFEELLPYDRTEEKAEKCLFSRAYSVSRYISTRPG